MQQAQGDWILSTDADLSSPIEEVDKLINSVKYVAENATKFMSTAG